MGVIDRLRPQPRLKDKDPAVRAAAAEEIPPEQQDLLASLVRADPDPRVRRAAVRKISDPGLLAEVARGDLNRQVRDEAREALILAAARGDEPSRSEAALAGLGEPKDIAKVAKTAALGPIRSAALARLEDQKSLGSVARHAQDAVVRIEALGRIQDLHEVATVAMKSEFDDAALAALERIEDPHLLRAVSLKGKNGPAAALAQERVAALERAPRPTDPEVLRARRLDLCHAMEFLIHSDNWDRARMQMSRCETRWQEVEGQPDGDLAARFAAAREAVLARIARFESERNEVRHHVEEVEHGITARMEICRRAEAADGPDVLERLAEARAAWEALPPLDHPKTGALVRRFEEASQACRRRHEAWTASVALRARRQEISREAARLAEAEGLEGAEERFLALREEWAAVRPGEGEDRDLQEILAQAEARFTGRQAEARRAIRERQRDNLKKQDALCEELEKQVQSDDLTLRSAQRGLNDIRAALEDPGPFPSRRDEQQTLERLRKLRTGFGSRLHDLVEIGEWKKWASANLQEELCVRVERLLGEEDLERSARLLREIERRWREARAGVREPPEALRRRYDAARDELRARCEAHFARVAAEQAANLQAKVALCERAEALGESTEWIKTAEAIKALQAEWKASGAAPRSQAKAIWERFRAPCDRFFTRRKESLERRKQQWGQNQERKEALAAQVEALLASTEWEKAAAEVKKSQAEWKAVGPVRKSRAESLGQRFRRACDAFAARYKRRDEIDREARQGEREALCGELEALLPAGAEAPADLAERVVALRGRWHKNGTPQQPEADPLSQRFNSAVERLVQAHPEPFRGTDLDFEATRRKMEQLCARVEGLLPAGGPKVLEGASPAAILAAHLREALASNTMGGRQATEARWLTSSEEVKKAQAAWQRLGPALGESGSALADRFRAACDRFFALRPAPSPASARPPRRDQGRRDHGRRDPGRRDPGGRDQERRPRRP